MEYIITLFGVIIVGVACYHYLRNRYIVVDKELVDKYKDL